VCALSLQLSRCHEGVGAIDHGNEARPILRALVAFRVGIDAFKAFFNSFEVSANLYSIATDKLFTPRSGLYVLDTCGMGISRTVSGKTWSNTPYTSLRTSFSLHGSNFRSAISFGVPIRTCIRSWRLRSISSSAAMPVPGGKHAERASYKSESSVRTGEKRTSTYGTSLRIVSSALLH